MVVKRQCSFCAGEIEPGTGLMFVKRDGTVFHFCSGSCRKQQLGLGRVGHRVRWTRAHALKRELATAQASQAARKPAAPTPGSRKPAGAGRRPPAAPTAPATASAAPAEGPAAPADSAPSDPASPAPKKPRARRPPAGGPKDRAPPA
ncbi:MAG TPA: 50S ribosomal protein L24e [Thermoplasmata archaeon]|nr:50S ribosomal protein L24e [Thermoplasmata archaeon]